MALRSPGFEVGLLRRLLAEQRGAPAIAAIAALQTLEALVVLALPWLVGLAADGALDLGAAIPFEFVLIALVGLMTLRTGIVLASGLLAGRLATRFSLGVQGWMLDRILNLDYLEYLRRRRGDLLSVVYRDASAIASLLTGVLPTLLPTVLILLGSIVILASYSWQLAAVLVPAIAVAVVLLKLYMRRTRVLSKRLQDAYAHAMDVAEEGVDLLPVIRHVSGERDHAASFSRAQAAIFDADWNWRRRVTPVEPLVWLVAFVGAVLLLAWLAGGESATTPGTLVATFLYASLAARPLGTLANQYGQWSTAMGALDRLRELVDAPTEAQDGLPLRSVGGRLAFENVDFGWPGRGPVLSKLSFEVPDGTWLAIVGPNGSGKSTLLSLILRLVRPERGLITFDGQDIGSLAAASWRGAIGYVPQQVWLLNGTVADNLRLGNPGASDVAIREAARLATADSFIEALPQGYDTLIGIRGLRLSGGQQQRLAIARALLRDAPVLVMDEATSMFDLESQRAFFANARDHLRSRSVIYVTHDPQLLRAAEWVLVLPEGRLYAPDDVRLAGLMGQ